MLDCKRFFMAAGIIAVLTLIAMPQTVAAQCGCQEPDNGTGTATMPVNCAYLGTMNIVTGIPGGSIACSVELTSFSAVVEVAGGTLGGTNSTFTAQLQMTMSGSGSLGSFARVITVPMSGEIDWASRTLNAAVQTFNGEMIDVGGELFGDPDFCLFRVRMGTYYGLANSGATQLDRVGGVGTAFTVNSFFDVNYEIEFQGCPGSTLEGMGGTTQDQTTLGICGFTTPVEQQTWGSIKALYRD